MANIGDGRTPVDDSQDDSKHARKRKRITQTKSEIIHSPKPTIQTFINPFANGYATNVQTIDSNTVIDELARQYIIDVVQHYTKHNQCQFCHELIKGIPFSMWSCQTCFVCEPCMCTIFDTYKCSFRKGRDTGEGRPEIELLGNIHDMYCTHASHHNFEQPKCFICRSEQRACRVVAPYACPNTARFLLGRKFAESFAPSSSTQTRTIPMRLSDLTVDDIVRFQSLRTTSTPTTKYTCPHCKIMRFSSHQLNKYMRHQQVCLFRPVQCPFSDCDIQFVPHLLQFTRMHERPQKLLEISSRDLLAKLDHHYERECKHKVLCNLVECKQHGDIKQQLDASHQPRPNPPSRIIQVKDIHAHLFTYLQSLPAFDAAATLPQQPLWTIDQMKTRFPLDIDACRNEPEEDAPNIVFETDTEESDEDFHPTVRGTIIVT